MRKTLLLFSILFITCFIIVVSFLVKTKYYRNTNTPDKPSSAEEYVSEPAIREPLYQIRGVVRDDGLMEEEKTILNLQNVSWQIASLSNDLVIDGIKFTGFFIINDSDKDKYMGKCVSANIYLLDKYNSFINKSHTVQGQYTYGRVVGELEEINILDRAQCPIYKHQDNITNEPQITLAGTINRVTRPAPDIYYDYIIKLDEPVLDEGNASGKAQMASAYEIYPDNNLIWEEIENSIGKHVELTGYFKWGYAESKFFQIEKIGK